MKYVRPLMFLTCLLVWSASAQSPAHEDPFFASHAVYVYLGGSAVSPDGKSLVSVRLLDDNADNFPSEVTVRTPIGTLRSRIPFGLNAQVLWSEDSKAFAITGTPDGGDGQYQTDAFYLRSQRLVRVPLTPLIERAFGHPVKCGWPESPNVVALKWLEGSRALLMAAQIIKHSNCDSFGIFAGFVVDPSNLRIAKRYNQIEVKRIFGADLGPWLRDTDDSCVVKPEACYVPSNHPELNRSRMK
jgi:hypothetical protein